MTAISRTWTKWINLLKIIWLSMWLGIATLLVTVPIILLSLIGASSRVIFMFVRLWARIILTISGATLDVKGRENLKKNRSYIIIANHQSHFDGPALASSLDLQFRWIAKKELLRIPIFGHALKAAGNIFIDRRDHETAMQTIKEGISQLPNGAGVMFFAEGTRSKDGAIGQFKKGGFTAAIQTGFPILPVTIKGSAQALPKGGIVFHPAVIEVTVGNSIDPSNYSIEQIDELVEKTRDVIVSNYQQ